MKKLLLFFFIAFAINGFAQKNAFKVGLMGVSYGDFSIGYEREITLNSSINLNAGYWDLKTGGFNLYNYFDEGKGVWLEDIGSGWHASLEYRFYIGKEEAIKGFYVAPYFRYYKNEIMLADYIENNNVRNSIFDVNAKFRGIGAGAQFGYHWLIYDQISIDWYFIGIGLENMTLNADYVRRENSTFQYNLIEGDVKEVFSETPDFIKNKVNVSTTSDALNIKLPVWIPGIRAGFSVGYAF